MTPPTVQRLSKQELGATGCGRARVIEVPKRDYTRRL